MKEQSRARCIIGVDYPSRVVTEDQIKEIFENAKQLLKKNHNIDLDLNMQNFENEDPQKALSEKSEGGFTLKNQTPKLDNQKFRGTIKESTRIGTCLDEEESQELVSQERILFRKNMEGHEIDPMNVKEDPREQVIELQSLSKKKKRKAAPEEVPKYLEEKRVAGKKELGKHDGLDVIHYKYQGKSPQMAWHKMDKLDGKITFIDQCTGIENQNILLRKEKMIQKRGLSFKVKDSKSQIENLMKLNEKLIEMAEQHKKRESTERDFSERLPGKRNLQSKATEKETGLDFPKKSGDLLPNHLLSKTIQSTKNKFESMNMNPL